MDLLKNHLSYRDVARRHWNVHGTEDNFTEAIKRWKRLYLEGGENALMTERRGRPRKVEKNLEPTETVGNVSLESEYEKLKKRVAWLEMENEYLKKLDALIQAEEQKDGRKRK